MSLLVIQESRREVLGLEPNLETIYWIMEVGRYFFRESGKKRIKKLELGLKLNKKGIE